MSLPGHSTTDPTKLCPCVQERYEDVRAGCEQQGFRVVTIETLRDLERQHYYLSIGVSKTLKSLHLPQPPNQLALAVDACPEPYLKVKGWAPGADLWLKYTALARAAGLECGADWRGKDRGWDWPHLQLPVCLCQKI